MAHEEIDPNNIPWQEQQEREQEEKQALMAENIHDDSRLTFEVQHEQDDNDEDGMYSF